MKPDKIAFPNGLRLLVTSIPTFESATTTIWVKTGSRFEDKKINGISHFLEHMVFKGSKKRPSARIISEAVDSFGGEFNASTTKEWTNFYIKARSGVLPEAFDVLADMVLYPLIDNDALEREKGVIIEEIALYNDTPIYKIGDIFENLIFNGSSLGWDIIGSADTVKSLTRQDFIKYRGKHYFPENIIITVSGGVDSVKVRKLAKNYFGGFPRGKNTFKKPSVKFNQKKPEVILSYKKTDQTHLILGFRGSRYGLPTRYAEAVLATILGGGMSSRLFTEVREKRGLAYSVRTSSDHAYDNGYLATYGGLMTEKIDEAVKVILDEHYQLANKTKKISTKELKKAKEYIKGHLAMSLEDTKDVNSFFAMEELYLGSIESPEDVYRNIDKVSADEVYELAKIYFTPSRLNVAVIGPFDDREKFVKLIR